MTSRPLPSEPLFTPEEAAQQLSISVKTLMRHVKDGRLRFINVGTEKRKIHRFSSYNLSSFIEKQKIREVPPCPSTSPKIPPITMLGSNAKVIAFTALQKPATKKKQKP